MALTYLNLVLLDPSGSRASRSLAYNPTVKGIPEQAWRLNAVTGQLEDAMCQNPKETRGQERKKHVDTHQQATCHKQEATYGRIRK